MRKASFEVPAEVIGDFIEKMTELELRNTILGKNEDDEIEVEVHYDKEEASDVDELESYLEELIEQLPDEEEEEDEDED
jgi:hypothetical protein